MAKSKNFTYGELWKSKRPRPSGQGRGRVRVNPDKFTSNPAFLRYLKEQNYGLYLDYSYRRAAHTDPVEREIVINGNYPDRLIPVLLQHELGHLMLFDVNQFVSVRDETMRSTISKVIYTVSNLQKYGLRRLLYVENVVQDIIIETVSNGDCVCHNHLALYGESFGVKHLDDLESVKVIAQESCKKLLTEPISEEERSASYAGLMDHIVAMVEGLNCDLVEIDAEIDRVDSTRSYQQQRYWRRHTKVTKLQAQLKKLEEKIPKVRDATKLLAIQARLQAELEELTSEAYLEQEVLGAEEDRQREIKRLQRKRTTSLDLRNALLEELEFVPEQQEAFKGLDPRGEKKTAADAVERLHEEMEESEKLRKAMEKALEEAMGSEEDDFEEEGEEGEDESFDGGEDQGEGEDAEDGEADGEEEEAEGDAEASEGDGDAELSDEGQSAEGDSDQDAEDGSPALGEGEDGDTGGGELADEYFADSDDAETPGGDDRADIQANLTDHLLGETDGDSQQESSGHTFDCGLPHPLRLERSEAFPKHDQRAMKTLSTGMKLKKITLNEDDMDNVLSNRVKLPESELTYFRPAKREFDETDMLQGKRRLRASGVNVLIGLDISGSMATEWTRKFVELSAMVEELTLKLDIENVIFFTYNQNLVKSSTDINDLQLRAAGGNAFGYVYQQIMQKLPMMQKNEIILVTDCGDNLGFKLTDCVQAERNGVEIKNHISIIDTEEAGFYDQSGLYQDDWSLYGSEDRDLHRKISENIEALIDA